MWQKIKFRFSAENGIMCHLPLKLKKIIENGTDLKIISTTERLSKGTDF